MITQLIPWAAKVTAWMLVAFAIIVFVVDISCVLSGQVYDTVSTKLRILDVEYGNMLAWLFLGLWLHLFIPINSISIESR